MPQRHTDDTVATDPETIARMQALAACACPKKTGSAAHLPGCHAERLLGNISQLLIVSPDKQQTPRCNELIHFGSGYFCRCPQRIDYFKTYGY